MKETKTLVVAILEESSVTLQSLIDQADMIPHDILVIDDGTCLEILNSLDERIKSKFKHLTYENCEGFGALFINAYELARDLGYDYMITIDPLNTKLQEDIAEIDSNLKYGFDIVSLSRILENFNHQNFSEELIQSTAEISEELKSITEIDMTDPLSETKGLRIESLKEMELTEYSHAVLLQLYIQAAYFGLTVIELPLAEAVYFGLEFEELLDSDETYSSIMQTERYLYQKGSLN